MIALTFFGPEFLWALLHSAESDTETKVARLADPNIKSDSSHFVPKRTPYQYRAALCHFPALRIPVEQHCVAQQAVFHP
jgi:hypothetical protein